ncbi:MAG: tripartite tricarboxylate transporter permease, partial [Castellaniella sp.]
YLASRLGFEPAPLLLGFVLGPMVEENFRRALLLSRGDMSVFFTRPISGVCMTIAILMVAGVAYKRLKGGPPRIIEDTDPSS